MSRGQSLVAGALQTASISRWVELTASLADGLACIHAGGLIHGHLELRQLRLIRGFHWSAEILGLASRPTRVRDVAHLSPEEMAGQAPTTAADMYALGRMLRALAAGRGTQTDALPRVMAPWVQRMLSPNPGDRPTASELLAAMQQAGASTAGPSTEDVQRRAQYVQPLPPELTHAVTPWLSLGGALFLKNCHDGDTRDTLRSLACQLSTRGLAWRRLDASAEPSIWQDSLREALSIRTHDDEPVRLLVDQIERLPPAASAQLAQLTASHRLALCCTGNQSPDWILSRAELAPMTDGDISAHLSRVLGATDDLTELVKTIQSTTQGNPTKVHSFLMGAVRSGCVRYQGHRWSIGTDCLQRLAEHMIAASSPEARTPLARLLGAALAVHGHPASPTLLARVLDRHESSVSMAAEELIRSGEVIRHGQELTCRDPDARHALAAQASEAASMRERWLETLVASEAPPWRIVGEHLLYTKLNTHIERFAHPAIRAELAVDPTRAWALAGALLKRVPLSPHVLFPAAEAARAAGYPETAEALLEQGTAQCTDRDRARSAWCDAARHEALAGDHRQAHRLALRASNLPASTLGDWPLVAADAFVNLAAGQLQPIVERASRYASPPISNDPRILDCWLTWMEAWCRALLELGRAPQVCRFMSHLDAELGAGRRARTRLNAVYGLALATMGRFEESRQQLDVCSSSDSTAGSSEIVDWMVASGHAAQRLGDRAGAVRRWESASQRCPHMLAPSTAIAIHLSRCHCYREMAQWNAAEAAGTLAFQTATEQACHQQAFEAACALTGLHIATKDAESAALWWDRALQIKDSARLSGATVELYRRRAELAILREESNALSFALRALDAAHIADDGIAASRACGLAALCFARQDRERDAEESLATAVEALHDAGAATVLAEVRLSAASAHATLGHHDRALAVLHHVLAYAQEVGHHQLRLEAEEQERACRECTSNPDERSPAELLLDLSVAAYQGLEGAEMLELVTRVTLEVLDADRAAIILLDTEGLPRDVAATSIRADAPNDGFSRSIIRRCLSLGQEVLVEDVDERADLRSRKSIVDQSLRSVFCVPLRTTHRVVGVLYADRRRMPESAMHGFLPHLRTLAGRAAQTISGEHQTAELRRLTDELDKLSKVQEEFLATVSHELRTPLNAILGEMSLVRDAPLTDGQREALKSIDHASRQLLSSIEQLLTYSRVGSSDAALKTFELGRVIDLVRERHTEAATAKGLKLRWVIHDAHVMGRYEGVPDYLTRILDLLLDNAIKFTPTGEVSVGVRHEPQSRQVSFVVRDTGPGISTDHQTRIFQPFTLGAPASSRQQEGLGLGLATCRKLVHQVGGEITLQSTLGQGTTITVKFPMRRISHVAPLERRPLVESQGMPHTVLVVDDHPVNRRVLSYQVRGMGYEVVEASGGGEALEKAANRRFLAILMDCHMPDVDGIEATRRIRSLPIPYRSVPIFAVTADDRRGHRQLCLQAGMDDFTVKPFSDEVIQAFLMRAEEAMRPLREATTQP